VPISALRPRHLQCGIEDAAADIMRGDPVMTPFVMMGSPRPYRIVLHGTAQSGYVPDVNYARKEATS
jgi:hypothetical protein